MSFGSCAPLPQADEGAEADTVEMRRTGEIAVVGSTPTERLVLRTPEGRQVALDGEHASELRRLAGARVAVTGRGVVERMHVDSYEILAVDGQPVISGTIEEADGTLVLRSPAGQLFTLQGAPDGVRAGQTVWLQGSASLRVQRYGIIREP